MREWDPRNPGGFIVPGVLPPGARDALVADGVDTDDPEAVVAYWKSEQNGDDGAPFFAADYAKAHGIDWP